MNVAAIDIGTNTLLLLILKIENGRILRVLEDKHKIARLGEGVDKSGIISSESFIRAYNILKEYKGLIEQNQVDEFRIIGTSALRDAKNNDEIKNKFSDLMNKEIEIISGEKEAKLSYLGSVEDLAGNNTVLDIGGGSTEIIAGTGEKINLIRSLNIGAVRITERFFSSQEEKMINYDKACNLVKAELSKLDPNNLIGEKIAVAGTPTTIAAIDLKLPQYNAHLIHNHIMDVKRLEEIVNILRENSSKELINKFGVHPNRADVILGGAVILLEFVKFTSSKSFTTSCRGLRYGIIKDMLKTKSIIN